MDGWAPQTFDDDMPENVKNAYRVILKGWLNQLDRQRVKLESHDRVVTKTQFRKLKYIYAMQLDKKLEWKPESYTIVSDEEGRQKGLIGKNPFEKYKQAKENEEQVVDIDESHPNENTATQMTGGYEDAEATVTEDENDWDEIPERKHINAADLTADDNPFGTVFENKPAPENPVEEIKDEQINTNSHASISKATEDRYAAIFNNLSAK